MRILHISADHPDPLAPAKTKAVSNLLALATRHEHRVWSLNRIGEAGGSGIRAVDFSNESGEGHRAIAYTRPPKSLLMASRLRRLEEWIAEDVARLGFTPDVVHAHKLSIEGLIGLGLAERLSVPLVVSVQGNTDLKIVGARRDLRETYRRIWREAAVVFPFAPWAGERLEALLGPRAKPTRNLPCPGPAEAMIPPKVVGPVFTTAFHFHDAKNKNAGGLIRAVGEAGKSVDSIRLEVVGGGDPAAFFELDALADRVAPGRVRFLGTVPNAQIQPLFNGSCAFALISHRESFGMVFSEALLAGCPCLTPRGRAIDGYFEEGSVILAAEPSDTSEIAENLVRLSREEAAFKERLARLAANGGLEFLRRASIARAYCDGLDQALTARRETAAADSAPA